MFVKELTADSDYFLTDRNFASVKYTGSSVIYSFIIYGRLLQSLIDGHENVRVSIIKNFQPRMNYFVGTGAERRSKKNIEISNLGFVQNTKETLKVQLSDATIASKEIELISLLSDEIVSDVSSKKITSENYTQFLPQVEQVVVSNRSRRNTILTNEDLQTFDEMTVNLFRNTGIYPGRVSEITFPSQKLSTDSDGVVQSTIKPSDRKLFNVTEFHDYYREYYLTNTNTRIRRKFRRGKAEYQKFEVNIELPLTDYSLSSLTSLEDLAIRVALVDDDIEVSSDVFEFKNSLLFEEATAGARKIATRLIVKDPIAVLPDEIKVKNEENYPVDVTVFEFCLSKNEIQKSQLGITTISPGESFTAYGTKIYFDKSDSRSYAVTANKSIPGVNGVSNVIRTLSPPTANVPPKQHLDFDIQIRPDSDLKGVNLTVVGIETPDESALVYRQRVGTPERELISRVKYGSTGLTDRDVQLGDIYVYTAELQTNASGKSSFATTGFVVRLPGDVSRINFSITDRKVKGVSSNPVHSFKITENISSTAASDLVSSVNQAAQAGDFSAETEAAKQDNAVITKYLVYRQDSTTGQLDILGQYEPNKTLNFTFSASSGFSYNAKADYQYFVIPTATAAAALSYLTTVSETDLGTGKSYKLSYKKWRDSNYDRATLLPSYSEVTSNNIQQAFDSLPPGLTETVRFAKGRTSGAVYRLKAVSKNNLDCAFISWQYTGNMLDVLHFVVFANYNGNKAPIGISIPDQGADKSTIMSYCDEKLGNVDGSVIYTILPVLKSGAAGVESRSAKVFSTNSYPLRALRR